MRLYSPAVAPILAAVLVACSGGDADAGAEMVSVSHDASGGTIERSPADAVVLVLPSDSGDYPAGWQDEVRDLVGFSPVAFTRIPSGFEPGPIDARSEADPASGPPATTVDMELYGGPVAADGGPFIFIKQSGHPPLRMPENAQELDIGIASVEVFVQPLGQGRNPRAESYFIASGDVTMVVEVVDFSTTSDENFPPRSQMLDMIRSMFED